MTTLVTVASLTGQAWAESAAGERRLIELGDSLSIDEALIMEEAAQINLDFGNNQQLTLLGQQQITAEQRGELIGQPAISEQRSTFVDQSNGGLVRDAVPQPMANTVQLRGLNATSEGHGFVQLVRIGELIEADGITPVTLVRIQEELRDFGIVLPKKEADRELRFEHDYKREMLPRNLSEGMFIKLEPGSGSKGIYNQLDTEDGKVSGTISFDPEIILPGDTITVTDKDGSPLLSSEGVPLLDYVLTPNDISQGFKVDVPVVEGQKVVELNVTITDPDGNTATKSTNNSVDYPTEEESTPDGETPELTPPEPSIPEPSLPEPSLPEPSIPEPSIPEPSLPEPSIPEPSIPPPTTPTPSVTVKLEKSSGPNGSYNAGDVNDGKVMGKITFDSSKTKPGDKLTVTDKSGESVKDSNGDPITNYVLTQDDISNGITVDVPITAGDTQVELKATLTNAEGKSSSDSDSKPIDDVTPKATVELDDGTGTNGEYNAEDTKDGYVTGKVTFDSTVTNPGDTVKITDQDGKVIIERPITADEITNGILVEIIVKAGQTEVELKATVTDPAGNSSDEAKDSKDIDKVTPTAVVELTPGAGVNGGYKDSDLDAEGKVEGKITFDSNTTKPGDKITVTNKDGNPVNDDNDDPITDYVLTQDDIDNGITVKVPVDTDGSEVELKVELIDPAGNSSTSQDSNPVDATPVDSSVTVELKDPSGPNGDYNKEDVKDNKVEGEITFDSNAEVGDKITVIDKKGDPVSTTDGTTLTDYVITQNDIDNGIIVEVPVGSSDTEVKLIVEVTDTKNNKSTVTDSKTVDDVAPQVTLELEGVTGGAYKESDITDGKVSGKVTLDSATVEVGDRVVVTGKDNTVLLDKVVTSDDIDNGISVEVPVSDGDTKIEINATVTDPAGNEGRGSVSTPILPVYVKISVDEEAVLEGGELTYKVELVNEDGSTAIAGKDLTINLDWSGAAGDADVSGSLPTSITINEGASSNTFKVTTLDDATPELSESLVVTINSINGVSGTDKGFENPQIDASSNSATSNIIDKPTIKALDGNAAADGHITVYEKGLDDTTDDSETATGTLRVSAPTGLVSITIGTTDITLAQLQNLAATQPTITIADHGKLTLTSFELSSTAGGEEATWDIGYSYELTDAQTHTTGAGTNDLLQNINLKVTATSVDSIDITGSGNLGVLVIDDVPTIEITTDFELEKIQVKESDIAGDKATATKNYAGAFTKDIGADNANEATSIQYALVVNADASGLIDTQTDEPIKLKLEGGQVKGFVGDSTDLAFTIKVDSAGNVTLEQTRALKHSDPATTNDLVNIINGSISLKATITDDDGDTATNSVVIGDRFVFQDGGPTADLIAPGITIEEAHLFNGSNPDSSKTTSAKVSFTNVNFGADGVGDVQFTEGNDNATVERLRQEGLKSGEENLEYVLSTDGHTLTAYRGADRAETSKIFTVQIVDATTNPGYQFTLNGALDHLNKHGDMVSVLDIPLESILVTDGDGDSVTTRFIVEVLNDTPDMTTPKVVKTDEDTDVTFNSNADATKDNTTIGTGDVDGDQAPKFGTVTIEDNGQLTYKPKGNYSGEDTFTYTTTTDSGVNTYTVVMTVNPVADAPELEANKNVATPEDTSVVLGLKTPVITDKTDQNGVGVAGDDPERLGAITLTVKDAPDGTELTKDDGTSLTKNSDGNYTFVIVKTSGGTDVDTDLHISSGLPTTNVNYVTQTEYEAIKANPAEHRHENFEVEVSVDSYEVDGDGKKLADVDGANSKQTISVDVKAVTDDVSLVFDTNKFSGVDKVVGVINGTATQVNITIEEDKPFKLNDILKAGFEDLDGSEVRSITIKNTTGKTILVNGSQLAADASRDFPAKTGNAGQTGKIDSFPDITLGGIKDFSGDLEGIKVTLNAQDTDSDSSSTINPKSAEVSLDLYVNPIAGDVTAEDVTTEEDTAVAFMQGLKLTDDITDGGNERITKVEFEVPTGWEVTAPTITSDFSASLTGTKYTIEANGTYDLEDILKDFEITPPAHSSKDETITVKVTTEDSNTVNGTKIIDTKENNLAIKVTVTPVAEKADSSSNDGSTAADDFDVKLNPNHVYDKSGAEDKPFILGTDDGFKLSDGWSNEDGKWVKSGSWAENTDNGRSEDTFAFITPYSRVVDGVHDAQHPGTQTGDEALEGSVFSYSDGATTHTLPFAGEPVKIPMQYLDSVTFTGPKDWSGIVKMQVEAGTVDYDEDTSAATDMAISGEAWLTNIIIEPRADQVTLKVDAIIKTLEDTPIDLNIIPTSSDATETFDVTISDIPEGAKITYKGTEYDTLADTLPDGLSKEADGTYTLEIINFDKSASNKPTLTPPKDSNETIKLMVKAESVDSMTYINTAGEIITIVQKGDKVTYLNQDGSAYKAPETITDIPELRQLPIEIQVQGVPDEPTVTIVTDKEYFEDGAENHANQSSAAGLKVALDELITNLKSGETGVDNADPDGSETITLRITGLPEGFTLEGAGPKLGSGDGAGRLWVVSEANLANAKIVVPSHYSGTVKLTIQPVVTENDNPSESFFDEQNISFKVKPVTEATLSVNSELIEDTVGKINLEPVLHGDSDEFISQVRIAVSNLPTGVTLYTDATGSTLATVTGGYYVFDTTETNKAPEVFVKGPANFSGNQIIKLEYTVTDPVKDGTLDAATSTHTVDHTLTFTPVTDKIDLSLAAADIIGGTSTAGSVITTKLTTAGSVKLKLKIDQQADANADSSVTDGKDIDGSEQLTHILIKGVPEGVSVKGAIETAKGQWLIASTGKNWNATATLEHELEFVVSGYANAFEDKPITITTYSKDAGAATYEKDTIEWKLTYERTGSGDPVDLPEATLDAIAYEGTEDTSFTLNKVIEGGVDLKGAGVNEYSVTVTVRTSPDDETTFTGMTGTQVIEEGVPVILWTKTVEVTASDDGQAKLDAMLADITINLPEHSNSNDFGADSKLELDVNLSVHTHGISSDAQAKTDIEITPVTDEINIEVSEISVDEGEAIALNITLPSEQTDGDLGDTDAGWTVVDDLVYIHIADGDLEGQLTGSSGNALTEYTGTNPTGTPAGGKVYAVNKSDLDGIKFVPDVANHPYQTGSLGVTVLVEHQEANSGASKVSSSTGSLNIHKSNSGYTATVSAEGNESKGEVTDLISLELGAGAGLNDSAEAISAAFISGLPSGFTVWTGDAGSANMANNAGEGAWAIPLEGSDLPNIHIKPPKNWSGTLSDLTLTVLSGHTGLEPTPTDIEFDLVVNPVADGLEMNPTLSFGDAGDKIALNLNASMKDPKLATGADKDEHTELTSLEITGLPDGEKALFYIGDSATPLDDSQASFNGNKWTLTGLSQDDLNNLKFMHGETDGVKEIDISARTYEADNTGTKIGDYSTEVTGKMSINVSSTVPSSGDDFFLWEGGSINGFGGDDTVQLRFGDNLTSTDFSKLDNIETIDMQGYNSGDNTITGLTAQDVLDMTDENNLLKILGDAGDDSVSLGGTWGKGSNETIGSVTYVTYSQGDATLKIQDSITIIE